MGRLAGFSYREVTKVLRKFGFSKVRQKASHTIWEKESEGRLVTVPKHSRDVKEGTLRGILKQAGITPEEFLGK